MTPRGYSYTSLRLSAIFVFLANYSTTVMLSVLRERWVAVQTLIASLLHKYATRRLKEI